MMAQENLTDERPVIDRVYDLLASDKQPRNFYDIVDQLIDEDLSEDDRTEFMARLYTNMNIDGRFLCIGDNFWGLKTWYPVEQQDEEVASKITSKKRRKAEGDFDDYDDLDEAYDDDVYGLDGDEFADVEDALDDFDADAPFVDDEDFEDEALLDEDLDLGDEEREE